MNFFSGNPLWNLVAQSDAISIFVLSILLFMSVLCWALFFVKLFVFRIKTKQFHRTHKQLLSIKTVPELISFATSIKNTAPGYFLIKNIVFIKELLKGNLEKEVTEQEWGIMERNCESTIETMLLHDESYLSVLSTCAAVAPLLGLFGTVWGLIHAFLRISETQVADIATIAPGIAEALITTLAGLCVAIPALIMFNCLQTKLRKLEHHIFLLADKMLLILQHLRREVGSL